MRWVVLTAPALASATTYIALAISLLAVVAALASGVGVALITTNREREREMLDKMLRVADDFITASVRALSLLRELNPAGRDIRLGWKRGIYGELRTRSATAQDGLPNEVTKQVQASVDEAFGQLGRVSLLFFPLSTSTKEAECVVEKLGAAWDSLRKYYDLDKASSIEDVEEKRKLIGRAMGEVGVGIAKQFAPGLSPVLQGAAQRIADSLTDLKEEMDKTLDEATEAQSKASTALSKFTMSASHEAQEQTRWLPIYRVTKNEEVERSYVPVRNRWFSKPKTGSQPSRPAQEQE